jgi:glutathione synthase
MIGQMTERLRRDGMFFVGLDIIGDKVVEINVESAGGLQSVQHLTGVDFASEIIKALERRTSQRGEVIAMPAPIEERNVQSV